MTKEQLLTKSLVAHALDEDELKSLLNTACTDLDDPSDLPTAAAEYVGQAYMIKGVHYRCEEPSTGVFEWETYDTSGQNLSYADASGKPTLNGVTINGVLTSSDLKLASDNTERTEKTTLESTDKIPINDAQYSSPDAIATYLSSQYDNYPKYTEQYRKLFIDNGALSRTSTLTNTTISLSNLTGQGYVNCEYTFTQSGKIIVDDDFSTLLWISGFDGTSSYTILQQLYINNTLILQGTLTEIFATDAIKVSQYLTNVYGDFTYSIGQVLKLKITITNNTTPSKKTITIGGQSDLISKYQDGSYNVQNRNYSVGTGTFTLYNNRKKTLWNVNQTYAGNIKLSFDVTDYDSGFLQYSNYNHEVLWRNNSGATRTIAFMGSNLIAPSEIDIPDQQSAIFTFKLVSIDNVPTFIISCININL